MARYFFNVYDGVSILDEVGSELPDLDAVRREAISVAGEIIKDSAKRAQLGQDWRLEVADERGLILFRLDFSITETAAVSGQRRSGPS